MLRSVLIRSSIVAVLAGISLNFSNAVAGPAKERTPKTYGDCKTFHYQDECETCAGLVYQIELNHCGDNRKSFDERQLCRKYAAAPSLQGYQDCSDLPVRPDETIVLKVK